MKNLLLLFVLTGAFVSCSSNSAKEDPKLLLIAFDGFRHDYLTKTETPNFDRLVESGVISEGLIPVFPSKTFPNFYAIATGLYPENNGFVGNNMYDPNMDERFAIGGGDAVNPQWYEGEPIWNTVEKGGKKAGTMFWVGSDAPIQDMRPTHWKLYDGSMPDSARIDSVIKWLSYGNELEVDFSTLYFSFIDSQGHRFGPDSPEVVAAIERADRLVGYILELLEEKGLRDKTNLMIVSDHGMTDISRDKLVVLDEMIDPYILDVIAYTPALMANVKGDKLDEVYQALKENEENFRVFKKEEIPERFHLKNHIRVPELLLVADLGYTISTQDFFNRTPDYPAGGTHGFDNQNEDMWAFFIANGPDFKEGFKMKPFQNIHLHRLMTHLLSIEPVKTDGSLDSVSVMLN